MMELRIVHVGEAYWLVRDGFHGPVYRFNLDAPYRPLGFAAQRDYISPGDLIEVDEAVLVPYSQTSG
jgi:hypothetical protein